MHAALRPDARRRREGSTLVNVPAESVARKTRQLIRSGYRSLKACFTPDDFSGFNRTISSSASTDPQNPHVPLSKHLLIRQAFRLENDNILALFNDLEAVSGLAISSICIFFLLLFVEI